MHQTPELDIQPAVRKTGNIHVLVIPSEEFVPVNQPLCGIFQYHQASILKAAGYKVGIISISLSFSIPMLLKSLIFKTIRKKTNNQTDAFSFGQILKLAYQKIGMPTSFLHKTFIEEMPVYRIEGFYYHPPVENKNHYGWIKAGLTAVKEYIKEYGRPDIIHVHNAIYAGMLASEIKHKLQIPFVLTEHSTLFERGLITDRKILKRVANAYGQSDRLFAVSQPFCDFLNKLFPKVHFECLPNVLDPLLEKNIPNTYSVPLHDFKFINIAELHPKKDQHTLIRAFKIVKSKYPSVKLFIGGDGELSTELKKYAQELGLDQSICFLGMLNRSEVMKWLQQTDCFVLSSKFETFGVVVIEAMLFGKPVIATRCGGPEDIVTAESGLMVTHSNENELASAMIKIMYEYDQYKPEIIRELAISKYGKKTFLNRIKNAYTRVI